MACSGCNKGRGHYNTPETISACCSGGGGCSSGGCNKLNVFDWLAGMKLPEGKEPFDYVEVRFKNSRKEFFRNINKLPLVVGDVVAVEASPGHDIGVVSLTGELVRIQMRKKNYKSEGEEGKKIYRKAKDTDIEKWREAQALEVSTMYKARTLAIQHGLEMKISDVEYQGDKTKATFYYTADGRVDFRELIKSMAEEFKVRIEMRQIGARQEASKLGGIGACGRELCCSTWLSDFRTVSTSAARYQQLSLNPLKLAGQCGKLKCCLNYELDSYLEAVKDFPNVDNVKLKTVKGDAFHQKTDIFKRIMFFSYASEPETFIPLKVDRVKEVINLNKQGIIPEELLTEKFSGGITKAKEPDFENVVGQDSITRFDKKKSNQKHKRQHKGGSGKGPQQNQGPKTPNKNPQNRQTNHNRHKGGKGNQNPNQNKRNENPKP